MELERLKTQLNKICPTAYMCFKSPQKLPFICYFISEDDRSSSDDGNKYISDKELIVELYSEGKSLTLEERVEAILKGFNYRKYETYISSEKMHQTAYHVGVTEKI